jgi:hypothetical protein
MTRNKEIFLVGTFFLVVIIFGAFFWHVFGGGDDEAFEQIRKNAQISQAQKTATATAAKPATPTAPAAPLASNEMAMPTDTQKSEPENPDFPAQKDDELIDPTSRKTDDHTADWKVFKAEKNIFEFKYPADAQVSYNDDIVRVTQGGNTWKMKNYANAEKVDLQTWYNAEYSEKERTNCTLGYSTLKVASYEIKYVYSESGALKCGKAGYFAISTDKKNVLRVELGEETAENANKILATFKFEE